MSGLSRPGQADEVVAERLEEAGEPLDLRIAKDAGQGASHDDAVLERVAGARRRLRPVAEHPPLVVRRPRQVEGDEVQPGVGWQVDAVQRAQKISIAEDQGRRQPTVRQQILRPVEVGDHGIQESRPLDQSRFEIAPLLGADEKWDWVHPPRMRVVARLVVDVVGRAVLADKPLRGVPAGFDLGRRHGAESLQESLPVRADARRRVQHFVIDARNRRIGAGQVGGRRFHDPVLVYVRPIHRAGYSAARKRISHNI